MSDKKCGTCKHAETAPIKPPAEYVFCGKTDRGDGKIANGKNYGNPMRVDAEEDCWEEK